jgi:hypothetical protein
MFTLAIGAHPETTRPSGLNSLVERSRPQIRTSRRIVALVLALIASGCGGQGVDKAGGRTAPKPGSVTVAAQSSSGESNAATRPSSTGALPDGSYANTMTSEDVRRGGVPAGDPLYQQTPTRHLLVLRSGHFSLYDRFPDGHTDEGFSGTYSLYRNRIVFEGRGDKISFVWSFDGRRLRFTDFPLPGYYTAAFLPVWLKVG